ncbi:MAG: lysylphosphatidylglycerol synthase transmembrane domain-containing protein [Anaerolineales bacterium]
MRRLLTALILLLAIYFAFSQFTELQRIGETLRRGHLPWLGLAVVVQFSWIANLALMYRAIYRLLNMETTLQHLLPLVITSNFVNVVAPSGGVGGIAVFIRDARRHNYSTARVTIAGVLFVLFDYFGFLCVLALGLIVLFRRNNLNGAEIGASAVLLLTALTVAGLLVLGVRSASAFERVLVGSARAINRLLRPLIKRDYLSETRAHLFAVEAAEGLSALRAHWSEYLVPAALSLFSRALQIAILFLTFLAFDQPFSTGTLIAGYSLAFLALIVSPTPAGVGIVEGIMPPVLRSLGVPLEAALVITLAYRGLTFWLPFGYGFIAFRLLQRRWAGAKQIADG